MKYLEYDILNVRSHNYRYQARDHLHVLSIEEKIMTGPTLEKDIAELYCSVELTNVHDKLIVLSTLNIFLSITAFVRCRHNKLLLESRYIFATSLHTFVGVYIHVNFLLHENLLHSPSISSWS